MTRIGGLGVAAAILLTVVLALGLLYAYRSQSPAVPPVPYSVAVDEVQQGRVRLVEIEDGRVTLTLVDGSRQQPTVPDNGDALARAVQDNNRSNPAHPIDLRVGAGAAPNPSVSYVYVLLPLLIIAFSTLYAASAFARSRAPQRYETLARLGDLRDRGVITEDEFLNEKRRLLK